MIPLKCIVEYAILQGQSYDLGRDFGNFQQAVDGTTEQVKQKFEAAINAQLKGKRVRARSSRGYKQYEKDYEFDVSDMSIDDYYDNFVVVAHDRSQRKPREYFLKPRAKIQIVGLASGIPSPKTTPREPQGKNPVVIATPEVPKTTRKTAMAGAMKEENTNRYDAYSIESIVDDIKPWAAKLMKDPRLGAREFVKALGWMRELSDGMSTVAVYDLLIPEDHLKLKLTDVLMKRVLQSVSRPQGNIQVGYELAKFEPVKGAYKVRIKKTIRDIGPKIEPTNTTFNIDEPEKA